MKPALLLVLLLLTGRPPGAADPASLRSQIDRIQRECLRAYPRELLAEMAGGADEIPPYVETDPKIQMQFLERIIEGEKGPFYPSLLEDLLPTLRRHVTADVRFLDLGSGDGRVVFLGAVLGAQATGIEYDETLAEVSREALASLSDVVDAKRVHIVQDDFFEHTWSGYDVIYYFDLSSFLQDRVREKLQRELDPGALLLVGHEQTPFPGLEVVTESSFVKVYRRPVPQR